MTPKKELAALVEAAVKAHADPATAAADVRARMSEETLQALVSDLIDQAIRARVYAERHNSRTAIAKYATRPASATETAAAMETAALRFADWPLSCGIRLGDATADILRAEADRNEFQASGLTMHARFYRALSGGLVGAQRVAERYDEQAMRRAYRMAEGAERVTDEAVA